MSGEFLAQDDALTDPAGWDVTGAEDFNGDGVPDMAVGGPGAGGGRVASVWGNTTAASTLTIGGPTTANRGLSIQRQARATRSAVRWPGQSPCRAGGVAALLRSRFFLAGFP